MTITLQNRYGLTVNYNTNDIKNIEHDKACNRYSKSDLAANDIRPNDSVIIINFKDGEMSTFSSDWAITF